MERIWNNSKREKDREGYKQPMKIAKKCDGREYENITFIKGRKERKKKRLDQKRARQKGELVSL